jgi:hypothetical protein
VDGAATNYAQNPAVFDASGVRLKRLEKLHSKIDGARELKTVTDLQARVQVENGVFLNDLAKLQSVNQVLDSDRHVRLEAGRQRRFKTTETRY